MLRWATIAHPMRLSSVRRQVLRSLHAVASRGLGTSLRETLELDRLRRSGLSVGAGVFIGGGTVLDPDFAHLITIGDQTTLSIGVIVLAHDASTRRSLGYSRVAPVAIGARVFVGARCVILPGVTIGDDAIVGAGSVVTRDVEHGMLVAGNPARVLGSCEDYLAATQQRLEHRPRWERTGHVVSDGLTDRGIAEMRDALADGEAFIR
jgi:maltose O-acetyltransferase